MDSEKVIKRDNEYVLHTYARNPIAIEKGHGLYAEGPEGQKYLDFTSGIGVNSLGYCDMTWAEAVSEQAHKLQHTSNLYYTAPCGKLAKKLCKRTGMSKVFFGNSGAEANEGAIIWQKKAPQYQMKGVYQQADLFLLPTEYEIFGMVLLEAMFFRRVVLTTPNGGADMLLRSGENGLVLEKSDPARWAKALLDTAADPEKKARMEQAAYETVIHENTWDALADRFLKVYEKR